MQQKKLMLINILPRASYDDCRIKGSVHVTYQQLEVFIQQIHHEKLILELVVYGSGYQCSLARDAWNFFNDRGFNVKLYAAGMREWVHRGLPTEGLCKASYLHELDMKAEHPHRPEETISTEALYGQFTGGTGHRNGE